MLYTIMARSYDFEVMSYPFGGRPLASHHAATLVPTALALAEANGTSGQEMITPMLVGDDIAARVQAASRRAPNSSGLGRVRDSKPSGGGCHSKPSSGSG